MDNPAGKDSPDGNGSGPDPRAADHGGNLADAIARYGPGDWIDLSTGINPDPYPADVAAECWSRLPGRDAEARLVAAAKLAYRAHAGIVPAPGASALIRLVPRLVPPGRVAIPAPTYNEHARAFRDEGWEIVERPGPGVKAAVIVNPNNPDGRRWNVEELSLLAEALDLLVIDESFMDPTPQDAFPSGAPNVVVLKSFGKFYGLAGLRLGFALSSRETTARLAGWLGPWAVSGPALEIGTRALGDSAWAAQTRIRLRSDRDRLAELMQSRGWDVIGGTDLFLTARAPDGAAAQAHLASHRIWSRIFPYSRTWIRLGLPPRAGWDRLVEAMA